MIAQTSCRAAGALFVVCLLIGCASAQAQQADLQKLVADANSKDETTRLTAIHDLGSQGAQAVPALTALLKSDSPVVRGYAAQSLAMIGPAAKERDREP